MTQEERDEILLGLKGKVEKLDEKSTKTDEILFKLVNAVSRLQVEMEELKEKFDVLDKRTNRMDATLLQQDDKIRALFDGQEMIYDKLKSQEEWFESVKHTLDKHDAKIYCLEIKVSNL